MTNTIYSVIGGLELIVPLLISIAYLTLTERKVLGFMQRRIGPDKVGYKGILQPLMDGVKLIIKETIVPSKSNKIIFILSPLLTFILSIFIWSYIPFNNNTVLIEDNLNVLIIYIVSSLGIYGVLYSGWSSNSKYSFIGSLRGISQLISYEIYFGMLIMIILILNNSLNLNDIILSQIYISNFLVLFPLLFIFVISILAETNRPPFDLIEAESELVAGYIIEYSSIPFVFIYLGEYSAILFMSSFTSALIFGSYPSIISTSSILSDLPILNYLPVFKSWGTLFIALLFIWIRATIPRLRYDQLINLGWTDILPIILFLIFFLPSFFLFTSTLF